MGRQHIRARILGIIVGTALAGAGIHILLENLECAGGELREVICGIVGWDWEYCHLSRWRAGKQCRRMVLITSGIWSVSSSCCYPFGRSSLR
jgi:hypothetical protein